MLTANQQKWVDALRSGEFEQEMDTLEYEGRYCCLGVACVIAEREGVEVERLRHLGGVLSGGNLCSQKQVQKWLGILNEDGGYKGGMLVIDNDEGKTFSEIADIIEAHAEELFVATPAGEDGV